MIITHLILVLEKSCDIEAVRDIIKSYKGAKLDDDNYIVYYNAHPSEVLEVVEKLHDFKTGVSITNEEF